MRFQKGMPRPANSGRRKGTPNKKRLKKAAELFAEAGVHPLEEAMKELQLIDEPKERATLWIKLHEWCEPKAKHVIEEPSDDDELEDVSNEELLKLVKPNGPA